MVNYIRNINIFNDTRMLSTTRFKNNTIEAVANTSVYKEPLNLEVRQLRREPTIRFSEEGTITEAVLAAKSGDKVAVLNFADALVPGGLVLHGEVTQEEDICRCSNLYECLIKPECLKDYYTYNRNFGSVYSDRLIYSNGVLVFKYDSTYTELRNPVHIDVITCPAPATAVKQEVYCRRIECILKAARYNKVDTIILGAWGCGAFGGDASVVGACFAHVLKQCKFFKRVVFAIKCVVKSTDNNNSVKFKQGFYPEYNS